MQRAKPPFRADMVGSLLRPQALKKARAKRAAGEIGADALREVEDREIEKTIARQQETGLQSPAARWSTPARAFSSTACRPKRKPSRSPARSAFPTLIR